MDTTVSGTGPRKIESLIDDLTCEDMKDCRRARGAFVAMGKDAVPHLARVLSHYRGWQRWEAVKALGQIDGPESAEALVEALGDRDFDIRYLAAKGLIHRGNEALIPLMDGLISHSKSAWFRDGARHVLSDFSHSGSRRLLSPLTDALKGPAPALQVPLEARKVLDALLEKHGRGQRSARAGKHAGHSPEKLDSGAK
jgi:HEAT repeat protein